MWWHATPLRISLEGVASFSPWQRPERLLSYLLSGGKRPRQTLRAYFTSWGLHHEVAEIKHSWQKMVPQSQTVLVLRLPFHNVFGNRTGLIGVHKTPRFLDILMYWGMRGIWWWEWSVRQMETWVINLSNKHEC